MAAKKATRKARKQPAAVKAVDVLGEKVPEKELKAALRKVLAARGLRGDLIFEKEMTRREQALALRDDVRYGNVYKYAFF